MAFPQVVVGSVSQRITNGTSLVVDLTSLGTINAGDLLLVLIGGDAGAASFSWPGSWVGIKDQSEGSFVAGAGYLIAAGGETSVTVSHSSERSHAVPLKITNWHGTTPPEINTGTTATSNAPNPGSLAPSWGAEDNLFIAWFAMDDGGSIKLPITAYPTNYDDNQSSLSGPGSAASLGLATRELNASSDDPGAFTTTGTDGWLAYTIAVRPAAGGGGGTISPALIQQLGTVLAPTVTGGAIPLSHVAYYNSREAGGEANPSITRTGVSWAPGDLILVAIQGKDDGFVIDSIVDNGPGETYSEVYFEPDTQGQIRAGVWSAKAVGTGSSATITATMLEDTWSTGGGIHIEVIVVSGSNPQVDSSNSENTGATDTNTPSVDVTTMAATTRRFAWFFHRGTTDTFTPDGGDGLTAIRQNQVIGSSGGITRHSSYYKDETSAGSKNASGTITSAIDWIAHTVVVYDAGGGNNVQPSRIQRLGVVFSPSFQMKVTPGLLQQLGVLFSPTTVVLVSPGLLQQLGAPFAPVVMREQFITPALLQQLGVTFSPTIIRDQFVTPALLQQLGVLFAPTVIRNQFVTPALLQQLGATFAPSVVREQFVTPALLQQLGQVFSPSLSMRIALGLITNSGQTFAPSILAEQFVTPALLQQLGVTFDPDLTSRIQLGLIANNGQTFDPDVIREQFVIPGLIDNASQVFSPTFNLSLAITLGLITNTGQAFAPSILPQQFVTPELIEQLGVLFSPQVDQAVLIGLISQAAAVFDPTIIQQQFVTPALITQLGQLFNPAFGNSVYPDLLQQLATPFEFSLTQQLFLTPDLIQQLGQTPEPVVTSITSVSLDLIDNTATAFAPQIQQQVIAQLIQQLGAAFAPIVTQLGGPQFISPDTIDQLGQVFSPAMSMHITPGVIEQIAQVFSPEFALQIALDLIPSTVQLFGPSVTSHVDIPLITSALLVPSPVIVHVGQSVGPDLIVSNAQLFDFVAHRAVAFDLIDQTGQVFAFSIVFLGSMKWDSQSGMANLTIGGWPETESGFSQTRKSGWPSSQKSMIQSRKNEG